MMAFKGEKRKAALIDRLAQKATRKRGAGALASRFVRQYYAQVPPEDIFSTPEEDLLGAALSMWRLAQNRKGAAPKIRIFNPDPKNDGWSSSHTVIELVNDDMPFLVDSVTAELNRRNLTIHLVIHPVVHVRRKTGKLHALAERCEATREHKAESLMHLEINEQTLPETLDRLNESLREILADVRAAVEDWRSMRVRVADIIAELDSSPPPVPSDELEETKAYLHWLDAKNFTFLGYREHAFRTVGRKTTLHVEPDTGLGLLRRETVSVFEGLQDGALLPPEVAEFLRLPGLMMNSKSNGRSTVHRAVHLDTVAIKKLDAAGRVIGQRLFIGLFTSSVYYQALRDIPVLRHKVRKVVERSGFAPQAHDGKSLLNILESLPRDDLFQLSTEDLFDTAVGILHLQERQRVALFVRHDPFGRFVSCLIYVPRERYTTQLREHMQRIVEEGFGGRMSVFYVQVAESALARLQFIVKVTPGESAPSTLDEIEARLIDAGRDWSDDLGHALVDEHGEARGLDLCRVFAQAFPSSYSERYGARDAVADIAKIRSLDKTGSIAMDLHRSDNCGPNEVRFKVYHVNAPVPLSDVLPMLENLGFKVVGEVPNRVEPAERDDTIWIHDFSLATRGQVVVELDQIKKNFEDLFVRVWDHDAEDDGFNRLVIAAGLGWRQVVTLRAYCKYLRQVGIPFSQAYMEDTLADNPAITRMIVDLFEIQFDPHLNGDRERRVEKLRQQAEQALEEVENLDEDRILRRFINVVCSTLRTNFYQTTADGDSKPYLSFKIDSQSVDELPLPRPLVEIFVYSPRVEAIHLRGGRVARGGIRWSDRREDFRTEILGLMKSQMTKNAVIVPVGAKGGFVVKHPPFGGGREALLAEGVECYTIMMSGMLDITDNLKPGGMVHPDDVVRRDSDDPYLVVAADKGTATFSDIANGIAADYDFWLDDAFASGGSAGYDHKVMGITARGAWESVTRHFREMGRDIQSESFTCIGIGDMSGDVFGNGMLLSPHARLIGAFNHLHIFIDPDPDPERSFAERKRLFEMGRSSWADYGAKLISTGGGVFERKAKSIKISPEMREALGLDGKSALTPNDLIRALLRAPADLLWFGGIGTYVKSRGESHAEVGDRLSDGVRIDGHELRCKVIGEGANLGITQLGRIEYALSGGRVNADFIDNSAGVASSDHEVNIKILLGEVLEKGEFSRKQRDRLLVQMTNELAEHVLMDNYRQSMALTHAEAQSAALIDEAARFMRSLERAGVLDRQIEFLPDEETIAERHAAGKGLTRPELSVLLAYSKMELYERLLETDVPDDPYLVHDVGLYFPKPLRTRFAAFVPHHRLRREITATYVTNSLVNRAGPTFIAETAERTGASVGDITKAYLITRQVFALPRQWADIEALDNKITAAAQTELNLAILRLIKRATLWILRSGPSPLDITRTIHRFGPGVTGLSVALDALITSHPSSAPPWKTRPSVMWLKARRQRSRARSRISTFCSRASTSSASPPAVTTWATSPGSISRSATASGSTGCVARQKGCRPRPNGRNSRSAPSSTTSTPSRPRWRPRLSTNRAAAPRQKRSSTPGPRPMATGSTAPSAWSASSRRQVRSTSPCSPSPTARSARCSRAER